MEETKTPEIKGQVFKKPITEELSEILKKHTTGADRAAASFKVGCSLSTTEKVVFRQTTLTENNVVTVIEVIEIAKINCAKNIEDSKEALKMLNKISV